MLDDVLKTPQRLIGMVQPVEASDDRLHTIGCAGRVTTFTETEDNRYMITLTGISRFRLGALEKGTTPYLVAEARWDGFERDLGPTELDNSFDREPFLDTLARYLDLAELRTDWDSLKEADDELLVNSLAMLLPLGVEEKQALLEAPSLTTRRETLVALIEFALAAQGQGGHEDKMQ